MASTFYSLFHTGGQEPCPCNWPCRLAETTHPVAPSQPERSKSFWLLIQKCWCMPAVVLLGLIRRSCSQLHATARDHMATFQGIRQTTYLRIGGFDGKKTFNICVCKWPFWPTLKLAMCIWNQVLGLPRPTFPKDFSPISHFYDEHHHWQPCRRDSRTSWVVSWGFFLRIVLQAWWNSWSQI